MTQLTVPVTWHPVTRWVASNGRPFVRATSPAGPRG